MSSMPIIPKEFIQAIRTILPKSGIIEDISRRRAHATDASFYQLIPQLVLQISSIAQMQAVLQASHTHHVSVTFRAAGTSLSGQAVSNSVLLLLDGNWRGHEIINNGAQIRLQPGVIGAQANQYLAPYHRKIGPDPASINTCKIGGIAANNASGMCCGVANNTFYTLAGMTIILADGTCVDTSDANSVAAFTASHAELLNQIKDLGATVQGDSELSALIAHKYRLKNTTGYAINALTDYTDPLEILVHLMVGSEGTLGFIADITYNTVVDHQQRSSGLYLFDTPQIACQLVDKLRQAPVDAVELLDQRALDSVKGKPGLPDSFCDRDKRCTALLIETAASDAQMLQQQMALVSELVAEFTPIEAIDMSTDTHLCQQLWAIRKATFPAVGAVRETGTSVIIEDVSFPLAQMDQGVTRLQALFDKYNYSEALIFGHALAGNLHFVFTQAFDTQEEIQRYDNFMQDVAQLVAVEFGGSLKAEHGTGRNMAPFVELEWGTTAYQIMRQIKHIIDPYCTLNPGVILNDDPQSHIKHLKPLPRANDIVDKCIECGFCEPVCPSKELTFTPRQRIAIWRRIQQLEDLGYLIDAQRQELAQLKHDYQYYGIDTCAATGLCAERCPVGINTGDLIRELRGQSSTRFGHSIAKFSADQFAPLAKTVKTTLGIASKISSIIGPESTDKVGSMVHRFSRKTIPLWFARYPQAAASLPQFVPTDAARPKVVYFPSCATRNMGADASATEQRSLPEIAASLFAKAGYDVVMPEKVEGLCCGMPFNSKGFADIAQQKGQELLTSLKAISKDGAYPIVFDTSPCKLRLAELGHALPIYETTQFMAKFALDKLTITPTKAPIALHITCSSQKMGLAHDLRQVAHACADEVIEPEGIECCGFAGDKGMTVPELNASALSTLKAQIPKNCKSGYSNSRTCEIGLSQHAGIDYQSLLCLLDEVSA
jgi:D-lactate dehydrogenase